MPDRLLTQPKVIDPTAQYVLTGVIRRVQILCNDHSVHLLLVPIFLIRGVALVLLHLCKLVRQGLATPDLVSDSQKHLLYQSVVALVQLKKVAVRNKHGAISIVGLRLKVELSALIRLIARHHHLVEFGGLEGLHVVGDRRWNVIFVDVEAVLDHRVLSRNPVRAICRLT